MNRVAQSRHRPELDPLAVDQDQLAVGRQGAVRDDQLQARRTCRRRVRRR